MAVDAERERLRQADVDGTPWRDWGPYLADRQWATIREDYSAQGDAWSSLPHDHARSRAYRWGEDGLAGWCDADQTWCFALAFWNGQDPILKERLYGLTGPEGNHGEDVKEIWSYDDATPTYSWLRWSYVYPQEAFPYQDLRAVNMRRGHDEPEYELEDTGVLDQEAYWLITAEFAKAAPRELYVRLTIRNCGSTPQELTLAPTLWFPQTWAGQTPDSTRPVVTAGPHGLLAGTREGTQLSLTGPAWDEALFCENESDVARLWGVPAITPFPKSGIGDHLVLGAETVNPASTGTKAALVYRRQVGAGEDTTVLLRLGAVAEAGPHADAASGSDWDREVLEETVRLRRAEADEFYAPLGDGLARSAAATVLCSRQFYAYDVSRWLTGDPGQPPPPAARAAARNAAWPALNARQVVPVIDRWEYPWFSSDAVAMASIGMAHLDPASAKRDLLGLVSPRWRGHNGEVPAHEWNLSEAMPPLLATAAVRVFDIDGSWDAGFLGRIAAGLVTDMAWWIVRSGPALIGINSRGLSGVSGFVAGPPPTWDRALNAYQYGVIDTEVLTWTLLYVTSMLDLLDRIPDQGFARLRGDLEAHLAGLSRSLREDGWWDTDAGALVSRAHRASDVADQPIRYQSLVSTLVLVAVASRPEIMPVDWVEQILSRLEDETEFLAPAGLRSVSRAHRDTPVELDVEGYQLRADYDPGEARRSLFGGNTNGQGPVWPTHNWLLAQAGRSNSAPVALARLGREVTSRLVAACDRPLLTGGRAMPEYLDGEDTRAYGASHSSVTAALVLDLILGG